MDSKDLRGLFEAYSEVYSPEQIDEVLDTPEKANEYARKNVGSMVGAFVKGVANKDISQLKTIEKRKRGADLAKRKAARKAAEEQNEDFELWVNSLVEEGYDLSEYTWEEMYDVYVSEGLIGDLRANAGNIAKGVSGAYQGSMRTASNVNRAVSDRIQRNIKPKPAPSAAKPKPQMKGLSIGKGGFNIKGKPVDAGVSPIFQRPGAKPAAKPAPAAAKPAAKPAPAAAKPAAKPAPAAAKPAASGGTRPAALSSASKVAPAKPAPGTKAAGPASIKPKTPNPLMQKTFGYQTGNAPDQQKAKSSSIVSGFDMFDVVKGYLIGEGYAETEEQAIVIMANMSSEWRENIIDEALTGD